MQGQERSICYSTTRLCVHARDLLRLAMNDPLNCVSGPLKGWAAGEGDRIDNYSTHHIDSFARVLPDGPVIS